MEQAYIYLLPIVFMLHEFEEIIMMQIWLHHNQEQLTVRFPKIRGMLNSLNQLSPHAFAIAVLEEFILLSACTIIAMTSNYLTPWYCCLLAFGIHLIVHLVQFLIVRKYIPAIVTSIICLPYCIWAFVQANTHYTLRETLLWSITGVIIGGVNLLFIHKIATKIWGKIRI